MREAILGLWIEATIDDDGGVTVRLAGQLIECEVERVVERLADLGGRKLQLDVGRLTYVGARGIELLRSLRCRGAVLVGCPPVIADLIDC